MYVSSKDWAIHFTLQVTVGKPLAGPMTRQLGVVSYFPPTDTASFNNIKAGMIAIINPSSGLFVGETTTLVSGLSQYQSLVKKLISRNVTVLGYIPTGNGNHSSGCNKIGKCQTMTRINAQLKQYRSLFPTLSGIFFDEAAQQSGKDTAVNIKSEYAALRSSFKTFFPLSSSKVAFNAGTPNPLYPAAAKSGEIVLIFENSASTLLTSNSNQITLAQQAAAANGVLTWIVVHSCPRSLLSSVVQGAQKLGANYLYITDKTDQAGVNTYGNLPSYFQTEASLFS